MSLLLALTVVAPVTAPTYTNELPIRKWYVRRDNRLHIFNTAGDADAYLDAEQKAKDAVEKAQRTSRRARKRLRERIINIEAPQANTVDIGALTSLVNQYQIPVNLPELIAGQDFDRVLQIMAMAIEMQEEDDIETLLLM